MGGRYLAPPHGGPHNVPPPPPRRRRRRWRQGLTGTLVVGLLVAAVAVAAATSATAGKTGARGGGLGGDPGGAAGHATTGGNSGRRGRSAAYAALEAAGDAGLPPAAGFRIGRCGPLLPAVLSRCAIDVRHVDKVACCAALVAFNEARCWCDVHAFNLLTVISGNDFAFFFRAYDCVPSGTTVFHPRLPPPAAVEGAMPLGTCPKALASVAPGDGEGCGAGREAGSAAATALREHRQRIVANLLSVDLLHRRNVDEYEAMLATLFTPDAHLGVLQLARYTGRQAILEYLLSRTTAASGVPFAHPAMASGVQRLPPLWTASGDVALTADASADTAFYRTHLWVRFARCAPEVADVWVADNELGRLHDQFAYFDDARLLAKYMTRASGWCAMLAARCVGPLFPYPSTAACLTAYKDLRRRKRIMCNDADGGVDEVPPWGLDGNTVACRAMYVDLAAVRPGRYCRLLATTTPARCGEGACPPGGYGDPFGRANPRHSGGGGFECNVDGCREQWYDKNEWD